MLQLYFAKPKPQKLIQGKKITKYYEMNSEMLASELLFTLEPM